MKADIIGLFLFTDYIKAMKIQFEKITLTSSGVNSW